MTLYYISIYISLYFILLFHNMTNFNIQEKESLIDN